MKKTWLPVFAIIVASFMASCSSKQQSQNQSTAPAQDTSREALLTAVTAAETNLKTLTTIDVVNANLAITAYTKFAGHFPNDSLAPRFLFNAAKWAMSSGQYQRALSFYDNICTKYPASKKIPDCIFVQGFIYDSYLKDTAKAHAKYQEVINKYPDNELAAQAKAAISALGKTDEELMKEFEAKNKKQGNKA
jgi:TolA-binding protein